MRGLQFKAAIFDLDGVVTLTAGVHAAAWKELFDAYLSRKAEEAGGDDGRYRPFDISHDYAEYVDGKPRYEGIKSFLESRGLHLPDGEPSDGPEEETVCGLGNKKDAFFRRALEQKGADVDPATLALIRDLKDRGVKIAIASSSKNCLPILRSAGIEGLFDARVDGLVSQELGLKGKPHPDIFLECAKRLHVEPGETVIVEDAVSGVQAGRAGQFGLVIGIDRSHMRASLRRNGAHLVTQSLADVPVEQIDAWFSHRGDRLPSALASWNQLEEQLSGKRVAVFLDYDGTLTPIVDRPEQAILSEEMRQVLQELAAVCTTSIISGRGREDVAAKVGLDNVYYAGSHGFDISGPGSRIQYEAGGKLEPLISELSDHLDRQIEIEGIDGALVENKKFSIALHYRMVDEEHVPKLEGMVDRIVDAHPELRKAGGKKVFELRPNLDWDKGKALLWLLEALELEGPDVVPIYIGDDETDEDAFSAILGTGIGVLVSDAPRPTAASTFVQDTIEVRELLESLSRYVKGGR